jgi:hypothetical protein
MTHKADLDITATEVRWGIATSMNTFFGRHNTQTQKLGVPRHGAQQTGHSQHVDPQDQERNPGAQSHTDTIPERKRYSERERERPIQLSDFFLSNATNGFLQRPSENHRTADEIPARKCPIDAANRAPGNASDDRETN